MTIAGSYWQQMAYVAVMVLFGQLAWPWGVITNWMGFCNNVLWFGGCLSCNRPRPTQGLRGPSGPRTPEESEKSAERVPRGRAPKVPKECAPESQKSPKRAKRVRKEYPGAGPQKSRKSAPRSPKRVRKESKNLRRAQETLCGAGPIAMLVTRYATTLNPKAGVGLQRYRARRQPVVQAPNSCSTGPALWDSSEKVPYYRAKKDLACRGRGWPK